MGGVGRVALPALAVLHRADEDGHEHAPVFVGAATSRPPVELGGTIHPQRLTQWFGEHRKAAKIPTGTLHILRHTAATIALTSGVPVHIVAARLGDDPKTVLSTYAHLLPQSDELAAERVAAALAG